MNANRRPTRWTPEPPTKRGHPFVLSRKDHREAVKLDQHQFGSNWQQFGLLTFTLRSQSRWLVGDRVTLLYEGSGREYLPIPHGVLSLPGQRDLDEQLRMFIGPPLEHRSRFEDRRSEPEKAVLAAVGLTAFIAAFTVIFTWLTS